MLIGA
jgi:cytoplasmic tRNA 2-thiolation protein 1